MTRIFRYNSNVKAQLGYPRNSEPDQEITKCLIDKYKVNCRIKGKNKNDLANVNN